MPLIKTYLPIKETLKTKNNNSNNKISIFKIKRQKKKQINKFFQNNRLMIIGIRYKVEIKYFI